MIDANSLQAPEEMPLIWNEYATLPIHSVQIQRRFLLKKLKSFPRQTWRIGAAPISVLITLGHTSAECSESSSRGIIVHW